jgi:predicted GH43/DUF377 family glycosyl hydrolase
MGLPKKSELGLANQDLRGAGCHLPWCTSNFRRSLYRLGAVLLDLEQPWQVIGRSDQAILSPISSEDYFGNVGNVVFTCGAILEENGELKVYYGAADQVVCCASAPVDDVLALCLEGRSGQG